MIVEDKTKEVGAKIIVLESVDSTNNYAAKALEDGELKHGTVILAEEQTNGRGQRHNSWQSAPYQNLHFSFYVEPDRMQICVQSVLSYLTSICLVRTLSKYGVQAQIKWPNDVFIGSAKVSGILIETQCTGEWVKGAIVGVGINVNQTDFAELNATSMANATGKSFDLKEVLNQFLIEFNPLWRAFRFMPYDAIKNEYYRYLLGYKSLRQFSDKEGVFAGIIEGVDDAGRLIVYKNGTQVCYDLKEIQFLMN